VSGPLYDMMSRGVSLRLVACGKHMKLTVFGPSKVPPPVKMDKKWLTALIDELTKIRDSMQ